MVIDELYDTEISQASPSQQKFAVNCTMAVLKAEDFMFVFEESCSLHHKKSVIVGMAIWICRNTLLNNFVLNVITVLLLKSKKKRSCKF